MRKTLLFVTMLALFGSISAMQKSLTPVSENDPMVLPNSVELQAGTLDTSRHFYDMICTGRCNLEQKIGMIPEVLHMDKIPSFVEVCKSGTNVGEIVFATPKPMGTVTLPAGHDAYVTITLQRLKSAFEKTDTDPKSAEYIALGVREQGKDNFLRVLRKPYEVPIENSNEEFEKKNDASVCLRMDTNNVVELVPLLSATNLLTDYYNEIKPETAVKAWGAVSTLNPSDFNFGSVFRVDVVCSDELPENRREWEIMPWGMAGYSLCYANGLFLSSGGDQSWINKNYDRWISPKNSELLIDPGTSILFYSRKSAQYLFMDAFGTACTSISGEVWGRDNMHDLSSYDRDKYGDIEAGADCEETFIVVSEKGYLWRLVDGETKWSPPDDSLRNLAVKSEHGVACLAYGAGVLIAATDSGWISRSKDKGNTWSLPKKKFEDDCNIIDVAFGEGKFLANSCCTHTKTWMSTDKGQTWQIDTDGYSGLRLTYGENAFYSNEGGEVYRSPYINLIK